MGEGSGSILGFQIDHEFEFCAPQYFDFIKEETQEEIRQAEFWFERSASDAPSPFMPKIKLSRFTEVQKLGSSGDSEGKINESESKLEFKIESSVPSTMPISILEVPINVEELNKDANNQEKVISFECIREPQNGEDVNIPILPTKGARSTVGEFTSAISLLHSSKITAVTVSENVNDKERPHKSPGNRNAVETQTPEGQKVPMEPKTSKKSTNQIKKNSVVKPRNQASAGLAEKVANPKSLMKCPGALSSKKVIPSDIGQQFQAIKKQKLDGGKCRQILNAKNHILPHKSKGFTSDEINEETPFISAAEMVQKFQSKTRDIEFPQNRFNSHVDTASEVKRRPKLTLTRPKEPMLETAHRVRAVRVKSSQELEEDMLAKMPKFKARPVNKKILEGPSIPAPPRSIPHLPEFQEFHLRTMERANQHAETSSIVSSSLDSSYQNQARAAPPKLTEPRAPNLLLPLRARATRTKTTEEIQLEELENVPKFKARPINKKIFESKGDLGMFRNPKRQVTIPQDFHFATSERLLGQPSFRPSSVVDLFDKLSIRSGSSYHELPEVPKITLVNPFHLHTEERGMEKERRFTEQILQKQQEIEDARIPKALPYPYTTDYPVVPPKPEPKPCTQPEAFQLESLIRHEMELQKIQQEKEMKEKEDAERRMFRAQPVLKEDPIPLPEKERKPLTEVQEFVLHVHDRALHRSEFDQKVKEKEMMYKRIREEYESAKQIEEEKAVKVMRRTMVPRARPIPKFDAPFIPERSTKEITKPKSPNLHVIQRVEQRRHASQLR